MRASPCRLSVVLAIHAVLVSTGCVRRPPPQAAAMAAGMPGTPQLDPILALPHYPVPSPNGYEVLERLSRRVDYSHTAGNGLTAIRHVSDTRQEELAATPAQLADNRQVLQDLRQALDMEWLYPHPPSPSNINLYPGGNGDIHLEVRPESRLRAKRTALRA